jgi:hypothetical protein
MSDLNPITDHAVDPIIAGHLRRVADQTDATKLLERVRLSRQIDQEFFLQGTTLSSGEIAAAPVPAPLATHDVDLDRQRRDWMSSRPEKRSHWTYLLTWPVVAALVLLATFLGGRHLGPSAANASVALRHLQSVHRGEVDRCYRVQYAPDPRFWDGSNRLEGPSHSLLWTRGDRFWSDCAIGDLSLLIGRQHDGTLWVSSSPDHGIQFSADAKLPQEVALLCAVNSMTVPRLVEEVLADFELKADGPAKQSNSAALVVWAAVKPGRTHPLISSALLEIDPESHVLTRLVLWMTRDGRPRGTVTYTFLESGVQDDAQYQLASHLDDHAEIDLHTIEKAGAP